MREIKFRGRRKNSDEWVYGAFLAIPCLCSYIYDVQPDGQATRYLVDEDTVGQFTGLLDTAQKEIYEGDVVERDNSYFQKTCPTLPKTTVGVVKWCDGEFIVTGSYKLFSSSDKFPIRVIGNIHDNPELLEAHA